MTAQAHLRAALALLAVAAIWVFVLAIAPLQHPPVAAAGAFDLTVTAGAAMYFLAVRRGHLPRWMLTVTIAAGVLAARFVLHRVSGLAAVAVLELAVVGLVIVRVRRGGVPPFFYRVLLTELQVMANLVVGWRRPRRDPNIFTSHRTNGWSLIAGTFIALTFVETPLVHIVLVRFDHEVIAWIATGLSLYSVAWLIGDLHGLRHGGVVVTATTIEMRLGVRWRASIPRDAIASVTRCDGAPTKHIDFSVLGANVLLSLTSPVEVHGLFGRRRTVDVLALSIDEPDRFERALGNPTGVGVSERRDTPD